jgi:ribosome biogenesis GTPase
LSDKQKQLERFHKGAQHEERRKQLRQANKKFKRGQQNTRKRRRDWLPDNPDTLDDWDDADYTAVERIMPLDESERRRSVEAAAFRSAADSDEPADDELQAPDGLTGLVIEVSKGLCRVEVADQVLLCGLRGSLTAESSGYMNPVTVGDEVIITEDGAGGGIVEQVLPRRSVLARPDTFYTHMQQVIVANVDQLLIVAAWRNPPIWLEMIDRYLVFARRNDLPAVICVNKDDLIADEAEFAATMRPYHDLGYAVIRTSALTGAGIDDLRDALHERTTVLTGMSGVGKSSLITAVQPGLSLRTSAVSDHSGEGRHTTTQATWLRLGAGGAVVDTPGIREFGLARLHRDELAAFFPEIAAAGEICRFRDCQHLNEPGCAVRAGVESGRIAHSRYHSYQLIHADLA